jgi:glycosyltransferase involved in cell wall biosynthesis
MVDSPKIWCAIPVYNNAGTIADVARRCRDQLAHVLVIDDGSTDADLRSLLADQDVTVVRHATNQGKGRAILTAFEYAAERGADFVITLDGDGQHFPEDIPRFLPHLAGDRILIGHRSEVTGEMPGRSRFGMDFSDFWVQLEAGGNARDTQSGFRAYPLAAVRQLQVSSRYYNFEMEIIAKALWAGLWVESVPIRVWYPPVEQRVSSFDPVRDNWRISKLHLRLVLRQVVPWPHRRIQLLSGDDPGLREYPQTRLGGRVYALNAAVSIGLSVLMSIVLWPWGFVPVAYVAWRLHLNKTAAVVGVVICLWPMIPNWCEAAGGLLVSTQHPHWQWIVGSHLIALPAAVGMAALCYVILVRAFLAAARRAELRPAGGR